MSTKLYFHDAMHGLPGTFPTGEQSAATPEWSATGATTLRSMNTTIGSGQTSLAGTSLNNANPQDAFLGFFCSPPLNGAQTVGGGNMVLNAAEAESNPAMNFWVNTLHVYVWRPSDGTLVGTVKDGVGTSQGGTEPTSSASEQVTHITGITSSGIAAADGDVVICEVWALHTQTMNINYVGTFYYDGTTEETVENTVVSNHASYLELAETLAFQGAAKAPMPRRNPWRVWRKRSMMMV